MRLTWPLWSLLPLSFYWLLTAFWLALVVVEIVLLVYLAVYLSVPGRLGKRRLRDDEARNAFARSQDEFRDLFVELWYCAEDEEERSEGTNVPSRQSRGVFMIRALAETPRGAAFVREAVVLLTANRDVPFLFYSWREGSRTYFETTLAPEPEPLR